jgi:hypothetical protein
MEREQIFACWLKQQQKSSCSAPSAQVIVHVSMIVIVIVRRMRLSIALLYSKGTRDRSVF